MSKVTERLVQVWETQDSDLLSDNLLLHFKNRDRWFWREVADEGLRVYNMMFAENAEQLSPLDLLIANVAAAAAGGVFCAVAAALGIKSSDLECAVSRWYADQDVATPAIGLERLQQMLPIRGEPSWEHVVLARLYHERIVHAFQEALRSDTASPGAAVPCIDGLDPSDITQGDTGWTWRRPFGPSADTQLGIGIDGAGEAIARAGYRVTGRGFTADCQWLSFDTAATLLDPLDAYEKEYCEMLETMSDVQLAVAPATVTVIEALARSPVLTEDRG